MASQYLWQKTHFCALGVSVSHGTRVVQLAFSVESVSNQTNESFRQKWTQASGRFIESTLDEDSDIFSWIITRNGFKSGLELADWLQPRKRILDAGCGNGRITHLLRRYSRKETSILGVDFSSHEVATENSQKLENTFFQNADLMEDLSHLGEFDLIYCQEVLHHTLDPQRSFNNLVRILSPNGEVAIYVYKKKAVLREYADDFIRNEIQHLSLEESRSLITQITEFAQTISKIPGTISWPAIPLLGIKESNSTIHRFIYNNFFKNFWNEQLSFEENFLINFDWYHPSLCSRHTQDEIEGWFQEANLKIIHSLEDDFGITVRGIRV